MTTVAKPAPEKNMAEIDKFGTKKKLQILWCQDSVGIHFSWTLCTGHVGEGEEEEDYFITFAWISVCDGDSEWNENGTQILFCPAL